MEGSPVWQIRGLHVPASWNQAGRSRGGSEHPAALSQLRQARPSPRAPALLPAGLQHCPGTPGALLARPGPDPRSLQAAGLGSPASGHGADSGWRPVSTVMVTQRKRTEILQGNGGVWAGHQDRWRTSSRDPDTGFRGGSLSPLLAPAGGGHPGVYSVSAPSSGGLSSCLCPHFPLARTGHCPGPSPTCRAASSLGHVCTGRFQTRPQHRSWAGGRRGPPAGTQPMTTSPGWARPSREASRDDGVLGCSAVVRAAEGGGVSTPHGAGHAPHRRTGPLSCGPAADTWSIHFWVSFPPR